MKIRTLYLKLLAASHLLIACQKQLDSGSVNHEQPPKSEDTDVTGYVTGPNGSTDLSRKGIIVFYELLASSSPVKLVPDEGPQKNVNFNWPDYCVYIKDAKGEILESEYVLPSGDFFRRTWKNDKDQANKDKLLSIIKP